MERVKTETNPKGAGRTPLGIIPTNIKVTIPKALLTQWQIISNKTGFAREAITEKLEAESFYSSQDTFSHDAGIVIPDALQEEWEQVFNKPKFVREAIAEKLKARLIEKIKKA